MGLLIVNADDLGLDVSTTDSILRCFRAGRVCIRNQMHQFSVLAMRLPDYMVLRGTELLDQLPVDANGKFDRRALLVLLAPGRETS